MRLTELWRSERGQGLSEYLIIVALIAIAAIGVVTVFGRDVRELFSGTTDSLAGNQASNTAVKANVRQNKKPEEFRKLQRVARRLTRAPRRRFG